MKPQKVRYWSQEGKVWSVSVKGLSGNLRCSQTGVGRTRKKRPKPVYPGSVRASGEKKCHPMVWAYTTQHCAQGAEETGRRETQGASQCLPATAAPCAKASRCPVQTGRTHNEVQHQTGDRARGGGGLGGENQGRRGLALPAWRRPAPSDRHGCARPRALRRVCREGGHARAT